MILKVLEDFQRAPGSSRPAGSIGEVKFNIQIDYTSQFPLQSINFLHHQVDNLIPAATGTRSRWNCQMTLNAYHMRICIVSSRRWT